MQLRYGHDQLIQAGVDEAGRGCLAGPVVAAAVILPDDFDIRGLRDSKKLSFKKRLELRERIIDNAIAWSVASCCNEIVDAINVLNASFEAMHRAIQNLAITPELLLIDGNRFKPHPFIEHQTIIKGDDLYAHIAAASILAKTYRDELMLDYHSRYPNYSLDKNKGYPTFEHRQCISEYGLSPIHRKTFMIKTVQLSMF